MPTKGLTSHVFTSTFSLAANYAENLSITNWSQFERADLQGTQHDSPGVLKSICFGIVGIYNNLHGCQCSCNLEDATAWARRVDLRGVEKEVLDRVSLGGSCRVPSCINVPCLLHGCPILQRMQGCCTTDITGYKHTRYLWYKMVAKHVGYG